MSLEDSRGKLREAGPDGLAENDWAGWAKLTERLGKTVQLVGDDLFVTNKDFVRRGIDDGVADVEVVHAGDRGDGGGVLVVQAVPCVHDQVQLQRAGRGHA